MRSGLSAWPSKFQAADDVVIAGGEQAGAVGSERQHVAGPGPPAGFEHQTRLAAGAAVRLLGRPASVSGGQQQDDNG